MIQDGEIGSFAGFQTAGDIIHMYGARATDRGHLQRLTGGKNGRVLAAVLASSDARRISSNHIQIVVAGRAICADADL